jgi:hypothetical protein
MGIIFFSGYLEGFAKGESSNFRKRFILVKNIFNIKWFGDEFMIAFTIRLLKKEKFCQRARFSKLLFLSGTVFPDCAHRLESLCYC